MTRVREVPNFRESKEMTATAFGDDLWFLLFNCLVFQFQCRSGSFLRICAAVGWRKGSPFEIEQPEMKQWRVVAQIAYSYRANATDTAPLC
jgi:hypothetical protein